MASENQTEWVLPPWSPPSLVTGQSHPFPVRRLFCIGRNYADHVREMGGIPDATPPVFFMKDVWGLRTVQGNDAVLTLPYPPATQDVHYEAELVVALHAGGQNLTVEAAKKSIYGYAVGLDMTRRDLQQEARLTTGPWDMAKSFDGAAIIGPLTPDHDITGGRITLTVNGEKRQDGSVDQMLVPVPDIISKLSTYLCLQPGDVIFTGTPQGVGPIHIGDTLIARFTGLAPVTVMVGPSSVEGSSAS